MKLLAWCLPFGAKGSSASEGTTADAAVVNTASSSRTAAAAASPDSANPSPGVNLESNEKVALTSDLIASQHLDFLFGSLGSPYLTGRAVTFQVAPRILSSLGDLGLLFENVDGAQLIGQGHLGVVYKGNLQSMEVAVKLIADVNGPVLSHYAYEAISSKSLPHPHVVQVTDCKIFQLTDNLVEQLAHVDPAAAATCATVDNGTSRAPGSCGTSRDQGLASICLRPLPVQIPDSGALVNLLQRPTCVCGEYVTRIVMEFCDKGSLDRAIMRGVFEPGGDWSRRAKLRALLRTAKEIAQGMWHLHQCHIIHGDLTAANILLKSSMQDRRGFIAKVTDYGLGKFSSRKGDFKSDQFGPVAHLAPEVIEGQLTKGSDVYAFGMLLWQMVTAQRPFQGTRHTAILLGIREGLRPVWPEDCFSPLRKLGQQCLSQDFVDRPTFECIIKQLSQLEWQLKQSSVKASRRPLGQQADAPAMAAESNQECVTPESPSS